MNGVITFVSVFVVFLNLLSSIASAQSREEGERLWNEAAQLQQQAKSKKELEAALDKYSLALGIFQKVGFEEGIGKISDSMGTIYKDWGQHATALERYETALKIWKDNANTRREGQTLHNIGDVFKEWGQYAKALECYHKALELRRRVGDAKGEGQTLNNIGWTYWLWDKYGEALKNYEKALEIRKKVGDVKGEGHTLNNIGLVHRDWGHYSKAIQYYQKALEIETREGDLRCEANVLNNLGIIYYSWGQYDKAIEYYEQSLEIKKRIGHAVGEAQTLNNLGNVYRDWGQYTKAIEYYEKSLEKYEKVGDVKGQGRTLNNLGNVHAAQGQYSEALIDFQKGLEIFKRIGVLTDWAADNMGNLYLDTGEIEKAEPLIKEGGYYASLARLCLLKKDYVSAKKYYESLLGIATQNRNASNLFTAYTGVGLALEGMGDNQSAAGYFLKAIDATEDLRAGLNQVERAEFYNVRTRGLYRTAPYDGLARVLLKLNNPLDALRESEFTKARVFAEGLSKRAEGSYSQVPIDIVVEDSQLNEKLTALNKHLQKAYERGNKEAIAILEPQVAETKTKLASHVEALRKQYPLYAATKYPQPMSLGQASLEDDEWVLAYHVTDSGIIIYLTRGRHLVNALFKPIAEKEIEALVRNFRQPLEMGPKDSLIEKLASFDFTSGKKLSDILLVDMLGDLPKDAPVIIIPDGPLGMLPFEMLVLNDQGAIVTDKDIPYVSGAQFFGNRNPISYYQSVTALTLTRIHTHKKRTEGGLLCIADPVFHENDDRMIGIPKKNPPTGIMSSLFKRLNMMTSEDSDNTYGLHFSRLTLTANLAKALGDMQKKGSKVYTGLDASKSNFLDKIGPSLKTYDKIVFATHGYFGTDLPGIMEPVLVLTLVPPGIDGYLRMTEVMGLNMNADIVALTACQTGVGKRISGEGTMGMGRAFQYAGAKSVLMSLWSVAEQSSTMLVENFFKYRKMGKSKLESLKLARDDIRKEGFDHPFFWAPFILVGETN